MGIAENPHFLSTHFFFATKAPRHQENLVPGKAYAELLNLALRLGCSWCLGVLVADLDSLH
jgi:hypothetical protein